MQETSLVRTSTLIAQASSDQDAISLWLRGRSVNTRRAYRTDLDRFLAFLHEHGPEGHRKRLAGITLGDLHDYADHLEESGLAPTSRSRMLSAVKSLLSFCHRIGYLPYNAGGALPLPAHKNTLAERILTEEEVHRVIDRETNRRKRILIKVLYWTGARGGEISGLRWTDARERGDAGQITLYGKGGKTRAVLLTEGQWREFQSIRGDARPDDPIFPTRTGKPLSRLQIWRIVKAAGKRAGIPDLSPHWFRHAHASHALDRGCSISLVQATLGHSSTATTGRYLHTRPGDSSSRYLGI